MVLLQEAVDMSSIEDDQIDDDSLSERMAFRYVTQPKRLLPDSIRQADGVGPAVDLNDLSGKLLVITLGIHTVVERTGLTVSIWGSADQTDWGSKPLVTLRQRQYCGVYSGLLNLAHNADVRFLRVHWSMSRWGKGQALPQFGFEVFLEESGARLSSPACA